MRILIINADYPAFLDSFYAAHPGLDGAPYEEQMRARNESLFGVADFYSRNLIRLGHEAWDVHVNNEIMQKAWAREHGLNVVNSNFVSKARRFAAATPLRYLKPILRPFRPTQVSCGVLAAQIRHYRPDVLLNHVLDEIPDPFLWEIKPYVKTVVGQIAAPFLQQKRFRSYDLMLSSLPNFVDYFRKHGIRSELHRLGFETSILHHLKEPHKSSPLSFVGSLSRHHATRVSLIETICSGTEISIWGQALDSLPKTSPIHKHYRGLAWGREMYQVLRDSKITLNHHIGIAGNYANNMRLFEATGVGTMLLTDQKHNLHEMFEPGKEVAVYNSAEECLETIRYYLSHDSEREAIAIAGQRRTLRDHNYGVRMQELVQLLT